MRKCQVLIEQNNVLDPTILQKVLELHNEIVDISVTVEGSHFGWGDLCFKIGKKCLKNSVLEICSWNKTVIDELTTGKIEYDLNSVDERLECADRNDNSVNFKQREFFISRSCL